MTNLSGSSEDSGVSTGHKTHYGTMEDEKFFAENGRRRFQESPPDSPMTNGWHMDEDANMSFEFSTPMKKSSSKRKLSLDSDESASAMKKSKLAMTLLEGGKHGVIDGRWVCGECGKTLSSASGLDQHLSTVHGEYKYPCDFCSLMFKRRDHATNHMKRVHQCTKTCSKCSAQFIGREAYADHMKIVHKIKLTYKTVRKDNEKRSIKKASPMAMAATTPTMMTPKKKIDEKSPKFSKNGKRLGRPRKSDSPVKNESTAKTEQLDINEDTLEMPPPSRTLSHECKYCLRRFHNDFKLLQHHHNMHREEMVMLPCNLCRRYFSGATCLHEHKEKHHKLALTSELSVLRCSYCSGAFHSQFALEAHIRFFHAEEECLCCGSVFTGAFEMYEHISEFHPPYLTPFGHQCGACGGMYERRHHAVDHFRRRHVYHWPYISVSRQVFPCPQCQNPFDNWEEMHQHVIKEHRSYGVYYCEPDYVAIAYPGHQDELEMLPCAVCNDFYHDQISLDKHIANDHEPFATRRPFNTRQVTFELENIEYAAEEVEDDLSADDFEHSHKPRKQQRREPKPKSRQRKLSAADKKSQQNPKPKSKRIRTPSPPPVKLVRSQVKKIIIPKKRTLKKRALQEERRKQRMQEEGAGDSITDNKKKTPPSKGDNSVISKANIIASRSRTRHAKLPTKQLPQRIPAAALRTRSRSTSSSAKAEQSAKRRGRSSTLKEETSDEDSDEDEDEDEMEEDNKQEEERPISRVGRPRKGASHPTQAKKKAPQPAVIPLRRRYLIKDDDDIFDDSDEEIMPTPKRRGDPKSKKKETSESSSEEEESDQSEDEKVEPKKPKVSLATKKAPPPARKLQEKWEVAQESDKEDDDDDEDVPISQTIRSRDKVLKPAKENIEEQDDEDSQEDEEASDDEDDDEGEEEEESDDDGEEGEEEESSEEGEAELQQPLLQRQKLQQKSRLYEYVFEDFDDLMEMVPKVTVRKMEKSVIDRLCGYLSSDESESEEEELVENGTENHIADKQTTEDSLDLNGSKHIEQEKNQNIPDSNHQVKPTENSLDPNESKPIEQESNQTVPGSNHQVKPTENVENRILKTDLVINAKINEESKENDDQVLIKDAKINEQQKEDDVQVVINENQSKSIENHVNGSSGSMQLLNGHCDESSKSSTELSDDANVVDKLKNSLQNGDYKGAGPPPCLLPNGEKANGNSHLPNSDPLAASAEN